MEEVKKMGGDHGISKPTQKLISALADTVESEHGVRNGKTALYWHLMSVVRQHAKNIEQDSTPEKS